jgi:hypothetical protein
LRRLVCRVSRGCWGAQRSRPRPPPPPPPAPPHSSARVASTPSGGRRGRVGTPSRRRGGKTGTAGPGVCRWRHGPSFSGLPPPSGLLTSSARPKNSRLAASRPADARLCASQRYPCAASRACRAASGGRPAELIPAAVVRVARAASRASNVRAGGALAREAGRAASRAHAASTTPPRSAFSRQKKDTVGSASAPSIALMWLR